MDPFITLLEIHKLMYFMQEAGELLKLRYQRGPYGPYAENLRHVLNIMEGHWIVGYADGEDNPTREIILQPGIVEKADAFITRYPDTLARFERVGDLIEGFETSFGMELLATVHWLNAHEEAATMDKAVRQTHAWSTRKKMFTPRDIRIAWEILDSKKWLAKNHMT